ncbi:hypothetical protein [Telmatospirillum sp.]|uniref:hypothetical protein n=1 Tax=Telmatospirillum sp. TaxID=2079197 RepID=UPI0028519B26|nr:hypothetical protein [Telmatospirillum sp.]MDR3436528.1 hypothetical protein [Telmatospirillum sp.]
MNQDTNSLPRSRGAIDRLEKAVNRLEDAMGQPAADLFGTAELKATRDDYARLDEASQIVEARLDAVIDRLKTILED